MAKRGEFWLSDSERRSYAFRRVGAGEYERIPTEVDVLDNLNLSANYVDTDGTIWMGHSEKLFRIYPSYANRAPEPGKTIITGILGLFFLISCGPKRYKCGPGRRCEVKQNTIKTTIENQRDVKDCGRCIVIVNFSC